MSVEAGTIGIGQFWSAFGRFSRTLSGLAAMVAASAIVTGAAGASAATGRAPAAPAPGSSFRDCRDCPEMVVVPAGRFMMGAAKPQDAVNEYHAAEWPRHEVTIPHPFAVGRFQVTRAEYAQFVADTHRPDGDGCYAQETPGKGMTTGTRFLSWKDPNFHQTDRDPMVCSNFDDANDYVAWLARKTGKGYRLLSEAEYEYAERAGAATVYPWGDRVEDGCAYGNWADLALHRAWPDRKVSGVCDDGYAFTAPVGSFKPNAFGLYDMGGNALVWTADCDHPDYTGAPADGSAWIADSACVKHVLRGGTWLLPPESGRTAGVRGFTPNLRSSESGMRVARTLD